MSDDFLCYRCDGSGFVCLNCMESEEFCCCDDEEQELEPCMSCGGEGFLDDGPTDDSIEV